MTFNPSVLSEEAQKAAAEKANPYPPVDLLEPGLKIHPATQGPWYAYGGLSFDVTVNLSQAISLKRIADALETFVQQRDADALVSRPPSDNRWPEVTR